MNEVDHTRGQKEQAKLSAIRKFESVFEIHTLTKGVIRLFTLPNFQAQLVSKIKKKLTFKTKDSEYSRDFNLAFFGIFSNYLVTHLFWGASNM